MITLEQACEILDLANDKYTDITQFVKYFEDKLDESDFDELLDKYIDVINIHEISSVGQTIYDNNDLFEERVKIDTDLLKKYKWDVSIIFHDRERLAKGHFHIENKSKNFFGAIELERAKYFVHDKYRDKLSTSECKILNQILHEKIPETNTTYWELMVMNWNTLPISHKIKSDIKNMPDYSLLNKKE